MHEARLSELRRLPGDENKHREGEPPVSEKVVTHCHKNSYDLCFYIPYACIFSQQEQHG